MRSLLLCLENAANKYNRYIVPLVSMSADFYVRVFCRVFTSKINVKYSVFKRQHLIQCSSCPSFFTKPLVEKKTSASKKKKREEKKRKERGEEEEEEETKEMNEMNEEEEEEQEEQQQEESSPSFLPPVNTGVQKHNVDHSRIDVNLYRGISLTNLLSNPRPDDHETDPLHCPDCGGNLHAFGPFYSYPLHSKRFIERLLYTLDHQFAHFQTHDRIKGVLKLMYNELRPDTIPEMADREERQEDDGQESAQDKYKASSLFYYTLPSLSGTMHLASPAYQIFENGIRNSGYSVSGFHNDQNAIKTDAPSYVLFDIMKQFERTKQSVSEKRKKNNQKLQRMLAVPMVNPDIDIDSENLENNDKRQEGHRALKKKRRRGKDCDEVYFQENPTANWGPKSRPKKQRREEEA